MTRPLLGITFGVRSLSLLGFPFLAGFFSKELILEKNIALLKDIFHVLLLMSLPLTSYYRTRLLFNVFNGINFSTVFCNNDKKVLLFSLLPLFLGSFFIGSLLYPLFYSLRSLYPRYLAKLLVKSLIFSGALYR